MTSDERKNGRYLLYIDILGFSELVASKNVEEVYSIINEALLPFTNWEAMNRCFRTIYFSDSFIFYQEAKGYWNRGFLDVYAIASMIMSALLAKKIAARGAISFGEFEVRDDLTNKHQVYFGRALIEAYHAEQKENWIGVVVLESAWKPYDLENPGKIDLLIHERIFLRRQDNTLLLNILDKIRGFYSGHLSGDVTPPYSQYQLAEFRNDVLAFKYLRETAETCAKEGDFTGCVASKYHTTIAFLKEILGTEIYTWGIRLAEDEPTITCPNQDLS